MDLDTFNYMSSIGTERNKLTYVLPEDAHFSVFIQKEVDIRALISVYVRYTRRLGHSRRTISSIQKGISATGGAGLSIRSLSTLSIRLDFRCSD